MTTPNSKRPTFGGGILMGNGIRGWDPRTLLLTTPLVLLRYSKGRSSVYTSCSEIPFLEQEGNPIPLLEELLERIKQHVPKAGPKAGKPAFPFALVAATYEFGQRFSPHENAFPYSDQLEDDEFFASIFIDAYRPDLHGGTERFGYTGVIPAGWIENGPELRSSPPGHDPSPIIGHTVPSGIEPSPLTPAYNYEEYAKKIKTIKDYLSAGDIYQANLTLPLIGKTPVPPEAVFDKGLSRGGSCFSGMIVLPRGTLLSFSPELFLRRRDFVLDTRPIKGTRPIPNTPDGEALAQKELESSAKDRAEHLMIVDLERNDLGRVSRPGTIKVKPLIKAYKHPTVMHLESKVRGEVLPGVTLEEIFAATFPGGSITGAPKKRAMEIIAELETTPRGYYCGAMGWIDSDGDFDLSLPIRSAMFRPDGTVAYHAGGGIVADSDPKAEWKEIEDKVRFFSETLASFG
jgi:anthranilate/para-aminobenzoate synthase component I